MLYCYIGKEPTYIGFDRKTILMFIKEVEVQIEFDIIVTSYQFLIGSRLARYVSGPVLNNLRPIQCASKLVYT